MPVSSPDNIRSHAASEFQADSRGGLPRTEMSFTKTRSPDHRVVLSAALLRAVPLYLDFLERHTLKADLENQHTLRRIAHRYENYWLPLVKDWDTRTELQPPDDVGWIWHLHLLMPRHYTKFCRDRFGRVIPHTFPASQSEELAAKERTRQVWRDKYPQESYDLDLNRASTVANGSSLGNILSLSSRERTFLYQVSMPHYKNEQFLQRALDRYKKFLLLHELRPGFSINPPIDIQLMWRTHLMYPVEYLADGNRVLGRVLDFHADMTSLNSHIFIGGSSSDAEIWKSTYSETLFLSGTGYRGNPQRGTIPPLPAHAIGAEIVNSCELTIDDVMTSSLWTGDKKLKIEARRLGTSSFSFETIFDCKAKVDQAVSSNSTTGLGSVHFDAKNHRGIEFHIFGERGRGCMRSEEHLTTVFYNPCQSFDNKQFYSRVLKVDVPRVTYTDPKFSFTCKVKADERKPHMFGLNREPFVGAPMPQDLKSFISSQAYWSYVLMLNRDMEFQQAQHSIKGREGEEIFSCQIVKSDDFDLGAVLLYFGRHRLVCVAHSIGVEQLAGPDQVSQKCPLHMSTTEGDNAMLIRNNGGDLLICVGRWVSSSNGDGSVLVRIFNLRTNMLQEISICDDELHNIKFDDVIIDMPSGRISIAANCPDVAENVCLAFCVGMMFVTCQKKGIMGATAGGSIKSTKSADYLDTAGTSRQQSNTTTTGTVGGFSKLSKKMRERKRINRRKMSASFTFLLASGLQMDAFLTGSVKANSRPSTISHSPYRMDTDQSNVQMATSVSNHAISPESIEVDTAVVPVAQHPMPMSSKITQPPYQANGSHAHSSNGLDYNDNQYEDDADNYMDIRL